MSKLLVLYFGAESPAAALADAAADGAKSVRFTEVDVRAGEAHSQATPGKHRPLESSRDVADYGGLLIACEAAAEIPDALDAFLRDLERTPSGALENTVFAVAGGENTVLAGRVSVLGGILVGEPRGASDPEERAKRLGVRAAKVIGWVAHALGHEHDASGHHAH